MRILQRKNVALSVLLMVALTAPSVLASEKKTTFSRVVEHYETARLALMVDSMEGVSEKGGEIQSLLEALAADWSAESAGVSTDAAQGIQELLPEMTAAAKSLAGADTLDTARDAFYELSKLLVRWRKAADGERPAVAYCPMSKRSWLQPTGEIGNPYHGKSMPKCGEIVDG